MKINQCDKLLQLTIYMIIAISQIIIFIYYYSEGGSIHLCGGVFDFDFQVLTEHIVHSFVIRITIICFNITSRNIFLCQVQHICNFIGRSSHVFAPHTYSRMAHTLAQFCMFGFVACILICLCPQAARTYSFIMAKMDPNRTMQKINKTRFNNHFPINHHFLRFRSVPLMSSFTF